MDVRSMLTWPQDRPPDNGFTYRVRENTPPTPGAVAKRDDLALARADNDRHTLRGLVAERLLRPGSLAPECGRS